VSMEMDAAPASQDSPWITAKGVGGFTINFAFNQTLGVTWSAIRAL